MSLLETKTFKVISYCEIPEDIAQDSWLQDLTCNVYTEYKLPTQEELDAKRYNDSELDQWIRSTYPELIGTEFLIEMDY